jgi:D-apionolactonase
MTDARRRAQADRAIAWFGTTEPPPERLELEAGPVSMTLENGALRWIRLGDVEILRGIAFLVRDRNWGTPVPEISDLDLRRTQDGFHLRFSALCRTPDGDLPWSADITGAEDGTLRFVGSAAPARDFVTNRTGFVILHPLEGVAGCPVEVAHVDGTKRRARFPALIDPEQCFFDIRALSHEALPGLRATCTMEGDAWEMEDHRNWLDASFKTYVRPLTLPHPYVIPGGTTVTQSVTLTLSGALLSIRKQRAEPPAEITLGAAGTARMPMIGLRAPVQWLQEAKAAVDLIRPVGPQLINGRVDPRAGHGAAEIERFGALAAKLGAGLMLELVVPGRRDPSLELAEFAGALRESGARPESIAVALAEDRIRQEPGAPPPPLALLGEVYRAAREALPGLAIGGGTFAFFTELNRNWPPIGLIDYVTHMVSSVVHAADDRSMMENLESIRHIVATVRAFAGKTPHRVVGAAIGLEIGAGGDPAPNPRNLRTPMARMDPRHRGLSGAAWTLAAIGEWARGGAAAVTPAALAGEFGITYGPLPYAQPWFDDLGRSAVFPIYHVIAGMAQAAGQTIIEATSSDPSRIAGVAHRLPGGGLRLWLANLRDGCQQVVLRRLGGDARLARLDQSGFEAAALDPTFLDTHSESLTTDEIEIGAYGVVRIESGR